jgi:hypothetical protein
MRAPVMQTLVVKKLAFVYDVLICSKFLKAGQKVSSDLGTFSYVEINTNPLLNVGRKMKDEKRMKEREEKRRPRLKLKEMKQRGRRERKQKGINSI